MTGIIITGHNGFAEGIARAVRLLTGDYDAFISVDFFAEESEEVLRERLAAAYGRLENCSHVIVLCDLLGGSPFKNAAEMFFQDERVLIIYGVNLPVVIQLVMEIMDEDDKTDVKTVVRHALEAGKQHMGVFRI